MQYGGEQKSFPPQEFANLGGQQSYPGPFPDRGRARGRGGRGRGRGGSNRGRGSEKLPTLEEHTQSIIRSNPRRNDQKIKGSVETKMSKEALNEKLNFYFETSLSVEEPYDYFDLNVLGYQQLAHNTYNAMTVQTKDASMYLTESEFQLACGWFLYARIFKIWKDNIPLDRALDVFEDVLPSDVELPAPIADYLNNLGALKDPTGVVFVPRVYMPSAAVAAGIGIVPATGFTNAYELNKFTAFFPFGLYVRKLWQDRGVVQFAALNNWAKLRVNPLPPNAALVDVQDPEISHVGCYTILNEYMAANPRRIQAINNAYHNNFVFNDTIRGRLGYNSLCVKQFLMFTAFCRDKYEVRKLGSDTIGSRSQYAYVEPRNGDVNTAPDRYEVKVSVPLSNTEMQLAAIMQYRIAVVDAANCVDQVGNNDQLDTVNSSPAIMHAPGVLKVNCPSDVAATVFAYVLSFAKHKITEKI